MTCESYEAMRPDHHDHILNFVLFLYGIACFLSTHA